MSLGNLKLNIDWHSVTMICPGDDVHPAAGGMAAVYCIVFGQRTRHGNLAVIGN